MAYFLIMNEIWKSIEGYENYEVSNLGNVRSLGNYKSRKTKVLKPGKNTSGYLYVILCKNGNKNMFRVHRLVATAFLPNPNNLPQVNHKNEIKTDNRLENLEWCSNEYNQNYGTRNQRISEARRGKPVSSETKRKISESKRGKPSGIKGKHHSEETKHKIAESVKRYYAK